MFIFYKKKVHYSLQVCQTDVRFWISDDTDSWRPKIYSKKSVQEAVLSVQRGIDSNKVSAAFRTYFVLNVFMEPVTTITIARPKWYIVHAMFSTETLNNWN